MAAFDDASSAVKRWTSVLGSGSTAPTGPDGCVVDRAVAVSRCADSADCHH